MSNDWHIEMSMICGAGYFVLGWDLGFISAMPLLFAVIIIVLCGRIVQSVPIIRNKLVVFVEYAWRRGLYPHLIR